MNPEPMGEVRARLTVFSPDRSRSETIELLVDTGASLTWVPGDLAHRLGIVPTATRKFRTMEGHLPERPVAEAWVELLGERSHTLLVFAEPSDFNVLGLYTLEGFALEVDPNARSLRKSDALLALSVVA